VPRFQPNLVQTRHHLAMRTNSRGKGLNSSLAPDAQKQPGREAGAEANE
jgi:hypothetical protein